MSFFAHSGFFSGSAFLANTTHQRVRDNKLSKIRLSILKRHKTDDLTGSSCCQAVTVRCCAAVRVCWSRRDHICSSAANNAFSVVWNAVYAILRFDPCSVYNCHVVLPLYNDTVNRNTVTLICPLKCDAETRYKVLTLKGSFLFVMRSLCLNTMSSNYLRHWIIKCYTSYCISVLELS